jgi:hypothetical protein
LFEAYGTIVLGPGVENKKARAAMAARFSDEVLSSYRKEK